VPEVPVTPDVTLVSVVLLIAAPLVVPCMRGLAHMLKEHVAAMDAKSKARANFLKFGFIDFSLVVFWF
jgi:hypothetical protein